MVGTAAWVRPMSITAERPLVPRVARASADEPYLRGRHPCCPSPRSCDSASMETVPALAVLRRCPDWPQAVLSLQDLVNKYGERARRQADEHSRKYSGRRGSMVLDVVISRRRRYTERVLPLVARWEEDNKDHSLHWLANNEPIRSRHHGSRVPQRPVPIPLPDQPEPLSVQQYRRPGARR